MPRRHRSISARASLLLGLGLIAGVAVGCMTPVGLPPQFRFSCESDDDCQVITDDDGEEMYRERCIAGLCQYPCVGTVFTTVTGECPNNDYFGCFNGVCSHLCDSVTKLCPAPQTCILQDVPDDVVGEIPGGIDLEQTGVCGIRCDAEGAPECPEGQFCIEGVCIGFGDITGGDTSGTETTGGTDTGTDTDGGGS